MKTFETWDDVRIAYQEWGGGESPSPPVILHHGFVADANAFRQSIVDFLA
jgi:pimeloyl-ACP methyl ester carboxylesterase